MRWARLPSQSRMERSHRESASTEGEEAYKNARRGKGRHADARTETPSLTEDSGPVYQDSQSNAGALKTKIIETGELTQ